MDNYDLNTSHVLPALLRKFHEAKVENKAEVIVWGSGTPRREFLHADDMADACVFLMKNYNESGLINIGMGNDLTIKELAQLIQKIIGYTGKITFDLSKPDGMPRKLLDVSRLASLGWRASIELEKGLEKVYREKFLA
jgi:GDP-L-fucose synthase